jgi:hypothetical protein
MTRKLNIKMKRSSFLAICFFYLLVISGCDIKNYGDFDDLGKFQSLIKTDLSFKATRWEVFNTPEYTGGIPGPTDYVTSVAEVAPINPQCFQSRPETGETWIAPESARPWLDGEFHQLLKKYGNKSVDVSIMPNCRKLEAKLRQSNRPVYGFICNGSSKSLIYLTLSETTAP